MYKNTPYQCPDCKGRICIDTICYVYQCMNFKCSKWFSMDEKLPLYWPRIKGGERPKEAEKRLGFRLIPVPKPAEWASESVLRRWSLQED
jgi:hypothetical protein